MPFRVEPRDLAHLTHAHHQLMTDDQLADGQRLIGRQTHAVNGVFRASYLANEIVDRNVREVLDEMLGERRPVRMALTAAPTALSYVLAAGLMIAGR